MAHAVVILDGAAWHRSQGLVVPDNITLLKLPPVQPGAQSGRAGFGIICAATGSLNSIFSDLKHIMDACEIAWQWVRGRPRLDPLARCGRLGSGFAPLCR